MALLSALPRSGKTRSDGHGASGCARGGLRLPRGDRPAKLRPATAWGQDGSLARLKGANMRIATGAAIVFLALAIGTAGAGAQDQKQPTTAQGAKPDTKFTSPITAKDKTGTKEATDFSKLVKLYEERERIRCSPDRRG